MADFYKAVVMVELLYRSESWVLLERMLRMLNSFHHRCARYIAGEHIREVREGVWHCPSSTQILEKCSMYSIKEYIRRRRKTVERFSQKRKIYKQCKHLDPAAGFRAQLAAFGYMST